ncbi:protein LTV1 homolog [Planococcus citri]|uniref:protein LTV1 homolog n=1 Tax=Planococcus citri TaxID=170843 RepID=UPI0031F8DA78
MPKKKKFIDKKKAVTFHLVHRSQHDPLVVDENAPQHVLVAAAPSSKINKDIEEEHKYGIYFDDDYDYLQHMRDSNKAQVEWVQAPSTSKNEKQKLNLPSSVFASEVEEEVGLLNKAAPQSGLRLDLDPDIVAAMDEDFNYSDPENELEDNFIELANQPGSGSEPQSGDEYEEGSEFEYDDDDSNYSDEQYDDFASLNEDAKSTKSRFTEYSMTSSVISRNSNLTLLDETFEQMYAGYDDMEIGALDCDDIEGELDMNSHLFQMAANEFEKERKKEKLTTDDVHQYIMDSDEEENPDQGYLHEIKEKEKWDCESILSTYSNIYNHPKLIKEEPSNKIRVNNKTGIPMETGKLTKKALAQLDDSTVSKGPSSVLSTLSMLSIRDKNESLEEKKKRKQELKEYRKIRRMERKANTQAFKDEQKRLEKTIAYNNLNHQGLKL